MLVDVHMPPLHKLVRLCCRRGWDWKREIQKETIMNKSLQDYALIAEIVGGIAVVLSLIYVGYQIQLNTAEKRADSIQSITSGARELALVYVDNDAAGIAWHKVIDGIKLTKREVDIMSDSLYAHLMLLEEAYNLHQEGYLEDSFLDGRVALAEGKILWSPQLKAVYGSMKQEEIYTKAFTDWLDKKLEASEWYQNGRSADDVEKLRMTLNP